MAKYFIQKAVVIGAGTMGASIAAHLANAGLSVTLLDIIPNKLTSLEENSGQTFEDKAVRNRIVNQGLDRAKTSKPASFFSSDAYALVKTGNLEDDFTAIAEADWIIEVIVEDLAIKQDLMARIDAFRKPNAIVSTNTSGIPVGEITAGRSDSFRQHFLGTHFFNPPRYLKLLEIIPTVDTLPEVVEAVSHLAMYRLGKGVVISKDTPNFVGNRLAFATAVFALDYILENGYTVEEVDAITGPLIGRPKTATFRLLDLVGVDVFEHVGRNLAASLPHDAYVMPFLNAEKPKVLLSRMLEKGWVGNKSKVGFYREVRSDKGKEFWPLNFATMEHQPSQKVRYESIKAARDEEILSKRMKILLDGSDKASALVRALTFQALQYASSLIPEVSDSPLALDNAIRWGYGFEAGYFDLWDMLGVRETVGRMKTAGFAPAVWVETMLAGGIESFYQYKDEKKIGVYDVVKGQITPIHSPPGMIFLKEQKIISQNMGATLRDMDEGIACLEFHTKMNAIEPDILTMLEEALDRVAADFDGLVIGSEAEHFSAGANLFMIAVAAQQGMWEEIGRIIRQLQNVNMRMRYFPKPVVAAVSGYALGGGCEVAMHAPRVVAYAETYAGLVELGMGVIPAGGGTKEMLRRVVSPPMRTPNVDAFPFLQRVLEQLGQAKVSTSADEARQMGIFTSSDRVVMNRDFLLAVAKREAMHMALTTYKPPIPLEVYAAGRDALAAMRVGINMFMLGRQITEYDAHIAGKLAYVMCGGKLSKPTWVDEQYILDLEREAFMSLCGEGKTQARIWNFLQTGKPLRN